MVQHWKLFDLLPLDDRKEKVNKKNNSCPFSRYIGNEDAIEILADVAFKALSHEVPNMPGKSAHSFVSIINGKVYKPQIAIIGPASTGKTSLATMLAQIVDLPFVQSSPNELKNLDDVLAKIEVACRKHSVPLQLTNNGVETSGKVPPSVFFIDEVHGLNSEVVNGLLTACEPNDATLRIRSKKRGNVFINCQEILWIIATTERGLLFGPFDTRFDKVPLSPISRKQLALVIKLSNPDWSADICGLVSQYAPDLPREALAFCDRVRRLALRSGNADWKAVISMAAQRAGIDEWGLTKHRVQILVALNEHRATGLSLNQLANYCNCQVEELKKFHLPPLMVSTSDQPARIRITNKHHITASGVKELKKRNLLNSVG